MAQQKSKAILLALSIGVASVFTFSGGASAKAPEIYFYPAKPWTVGMSPMEIANANVQNCSIKSEFNNGFIFQLDGTHKWVQSMNIDFRQDAFTAGDTYDVSFSVPGKIQQSIPATASNEHLLAFDMKEQKAIYQAMRDSSVIDMNIDGNDFRFYMTGFSTASVQFERCMAGGTIKQPKPAESSDGSLQASMSEDPFESVTWNESIALEEEERSISIVEIIPANDIDLGPAATYIVDMDDTVEVATTKQQKIKTIDKTEAMSVAPLEATMASMDDSFSPPAQDAEAPRKRMSEMLAEEIARNPQIIDYMDVPEPASEDLRKEAKTTPLDFPPGFDEKSAMTPLMEEAVDVEAAPKIMITEEPMVAMAESEAQANNEPFTTKRSTIHKSSRIKVNKQTSYMEADFSKFANVEPSSSATNFDTRSDSGLIKKISQLERMVSTLEMENAELNGDIQSAIKESENERMSISSDNWNLERATMRYNESERQAKRIGQQLQRERAQCNMEKKDLETMLFDPQVTSQQQLARLSNLERQLEDARRKLRANGIN